MLAKWLSKCQLTIWILVLPQEELTTEKVLGDGRFYLNLPSVTPKYTLNKRLSEIVLETRAIRHTR